MRILKENWNKNQLLAEHRVKLYLGIWLSLTMFFSMLTPGRAHAESLVPPSMRALAGAPGIVAIQPIGVVDPEDLQLIRNLIRSVYGLRSQLLPILALNPDYYYADRNQYDADAIIHQMINELPDQATFLMGITNADLFEPDHSRYVFGVATLNDRVGILSMSRLRETYWGRKLNDRLFQNRFYKVLIHEVGHTLGLVHCPNKHCAMQNSPDLKSLDKAPRKYCKDCRLQITAPLRNSVITPTALHQRGLTLLNYGIYPKAIKNFLRAISENPKSAPLFNDLGVAYSYAGNIQQAVEAFKAALAVDPKLAVAHQNLAIIYNDLNHNSPALHHQELANEFRQ